MATKRDRARQIRQFILDNVDQHPGEVTALAVRRFGVTRQAINRQIQVLVEDRLLVAEGNTQARKYRRAKNVRRSVLKVAGLDEHKVWRDFAAPILADVAENVRSICEYGFTEMLNNVVDHSESEEVIISVARDSDQVAIQITDSGVGIFNKIRK